MLTWDHVPPKGGIDISPIEIDSVFNKISNNKAISKPIISQDGSKYRTICKTCNERLGQKYDPILNQLNKNLNAIIKSNLILPSTMMIKTKPSLLVRAILGHLLAAKVKFDEFELDEDIRGFLFDESKNIPPNIRIFYWLYPFKTHLILRDFTMQSERKITSAHAVFNLIKHFPIAFLITKLEKYENLPEITQYCTDDIFGEADIPFSLKNTHDWDWPEAITPNKFLVLGQAGANSVLGKPYPKKRNK